MGTTTWKFVDSSFKTSLRKWCAELTFDILLFMTKQLLGNIEMPHFLSLNLTYYLNFRFRDRPRDAEAHVTFNQIRRTLQ